MKLSENSTDGTKHPTPSHRTLYDMVRWWSNQSFAYDRGGSFDVELYLKFCKVKQYEDKENQQEKTAPKVYV